MEGVIGEDAPDLDTLSGGGVADLICLLSSLSSSCPSIPNQLLKLWGGGWKQRAVRVGIEAATVDGSSERKG